MTPKEREAMQQAVDALEDELEAETCEEFHYAAEKCHDALAALREALAEQAEQEPVALPCCGYHDASAIMWNKFNGVVQCHNCGQIYAAPVRTKDLTDDEIDEIGKSYFDEWSFGFARAVIAKDRELNKCQH